MTASQIENKTIAVAVVDDDANVRDGLWWLLNNVIGLRCAGAYASCEEALAGMALQGADILLLDVSLPRISGLEAAPQLFARFPSLKIIMHSNFDDEEKITQAMRAGATGYLLKNASAPALYEAIIKVHQGGTAWPPGFESAGEISHSNRFHFLAKIVGRLSSTLRALRKTFSS